MTSVKVPPRSIQKSHLPDMSTPSQAAVAAWLSSFVRQLRERCRDRRMTGCYRSKRNVKQLNPQLLIPL